MRLNPDCIRDILLYCENVCVPDNGAEFDYQSVFTYDNRKYSGEELYYHLRQCNLNGFFVNAEDYFLVSEYYVADISPKAHEFLSNIRKDTIWQKTKVTAAKVGSSSLNALCQIASSVVSGIIKSQIIGH